MNITKIKNDITPILDNASLILYSIDYKKENDKNVLSIIVDKKGFVDIEDIEFITNKINEYLDKEDPIEEEYNLEISSRGLEKDFEFDDASYYIGECVEIKTMDQLHKGELIEATSDSLTIKTQKNKKVKINVNDIMNIHIVVKF
ncbi:hypothetical protein J6Y73_02600 [bacterium]|nr:hypothetical protein [bacterium]